MKIGLIEFGNGIIMPDVVTVSLAMNVHTISSDLDSVKSKAWCKRRASPTECGLRCPAFDSHQEMQPEEMPS
jgi:hypothetical protein